MLNYNIVRWQKVSFTVWCSFSNFALEFKIKASRYDEVLYHSLTTAKFFCSWHIFVFFVCFPFKTHEKPNNNANIPQIPQRGLNFHVLHPNEKIKLMAYDSSRIRLNQKTYFYQFWFFYRFFSWFKLKISKSKREILFQTLCEMGKEIYHYIPKPVEYFHKDIQNFRWN